MLPRRPVSPLNRAVRLTERWSTASQVPPAELLSTRPMEDPLESIMYMTSVGVPSIVYETVKNLRQARGNRLGAMQRKFPFLGIGLLYLLALVELLAFPLLGAGQ